MTSTVADDELERLRSRLARERNARRQAEVIAERGMRELWAINQGLQDRVDQRTAELRRLVGGIEHAQAGRMGAIADRVAALIAAADGATPVDELRLIQRLADGGTYLVDNEPVECTALDVADPLLERWQRSAARAGQLLTVETGEADGPAVYLWDRVSAVADVVLAGFVAHGRPGALAAKLAVADATVTLTANGTTAVGDEAMEAYERDDVVAFDRLGPVGADLSIAARIVVDVGGSLAARREPDGALDVSIAFPLTR